MADLIFERLHGTGMYLRGLGSKWHRSPKQAAKRAVDHGLSFVSLMGPWQDYRNGKFRHLRGNLVNDRFVPYAEAFAAAGLKVGIWFYPWGGHETRLLDDLHRMLEKAPIDFLLDDGELGHKWKNRTRRNSNDTGTMRGGQPEAFKGGKANGTKTQRLAQVRELWRNLHALVDEFSLTCGAGATAYGVARYHPTFPWEVKLRMAEWFSPQLYTASPKQIDMGIDDWYRLGDEQNYALENRKDLIASTATFGKNSADKLDAYLGNFVDGEEGLDGFMFWSWRQTSRAEWDTIAKWSDRIQRGILTL